MQRHCAEAGHLCPGSVSGVSGAKCQKQKDARRQSKKEAETKIEKGLLCQVKELVLLS